LVAPTLGSPSHFPQCWGLFVWHIAIGRVAGDPANGAHCNHNFPRATESGAYLMSQQHPEFVHTLLEYKLQEQLDAALSSPERLTLSIGVSTPHSRRRLSCFSCSNRALPRQATRQDHNASRAKAVFVVPSRSNQPSCLCSALKSCAVPLATSQGYDSRVLSFAPSSSTS